MLKKIFIFIVSIILVGTIGCLEKKTSLQGTSRIHGEIILKVKRANSTEWKTVVRKKNLITNVGAAEVAGLINGVTTGPFSYIAIGSGTTSPSRNDTALQSELARGNATESRTTTDVTDDTAQWEYTFTASAAWAVSEMGVFDASTGGVMLTRVTFSTINLAQNDQLHVIYKLDVDG